MILVLGTMLGSGAVLVWSSWWVPREPRHGAHDGWSARTRDRLTLAGAQGMSPGSLIGVACGAAIAALAVAFSLSRSLVIAACFAVIAARAPFAVVAGRARRRLDQARTAWPDAVDQLAASIRAGMALPQALSQVAERGPDQLREPFAAFAADYRASGRFGECLDALKARLADPIGDRIVETLRLAAEVGGTDVGALLRALAAFLRDDARTRGELEARQSWTVNAARLAAAAPWVVLALLATRPPNAEAYDTAGGAVLLAAGGGATLIAYRTMVRLGRLPGEPRVLR